MCTIFRRGLSGSGSSSISFRVMKKTPGGRRRRGCKIALQFYANYSSRRISAARGGERGSCQQPTSGATLATARGTDHDRYRSRYKFGQRGLRLLTCETERDHNPASLIFVPSLIYNL